MAVTELLDESEVAPESIGAILRGAREQAGYSIADVAERMRLSRHHIENLEAERFDLFPVSVFLRGYLTSYARLVGVDAIPLLAAYDRRGFGPPQLHSQDTARTTTRGSEFTVTVTTLIVIAVLIALSALWWRDQWTEGTGLPDATVTEPDGRSAPGDGAEGPGEPSESLFAEGGSGPEAPAGGEETAVDLGVEPPPVPAGAEPSPLPLGPEPPPVPVGEGTAGPTAPADAAPAPEPPAPAEEVAGAGASPEPATPAPAETPEDTPADTAAAEEAEPGAAPDAEPPAAGAGEALASLVIRVNEDCWLMVRDADQRLIYLDLASAGTVLELAATPPVRVVAGYAEGIEIEYNGEPFDPTPYVEQDTGTARFRLGS